MKLNYRFLKNIKYRKLINIAIFIIRINEIIINVKQIKRTNNKNS